MPAQLRRKPHGSWNRFIDRKMTFEDMPLKTMKGTIHILRWVFLLISLFIISGISILFITSGQIYMQVILGYSIIGFSTFFLGYFGWVLGQGLINMAKGKELRQERAYSYYFTKRNKHRF